MQMYIDVFSHTHDTPFDCLLSGN